MTKKTALSCLGLVILSSLLNVKPDTHNSKEESEKKDEKEESEKKDEKLEF